jgi:hypothetical protein
MSGVLITSECTVGSRLKAKTKQGQTKLKKNTKQKNKNKKPNKQTNKQKQTIKK